MNDPLMPVVVPGPMLTGLVAMVLCEGFIRRFQLERDTINVVRWQETIEEIVAKFCEPLPIDHRASK
jgi:hypothetical protein